MKTLPYGKLKTVIRKTAADFQRALYRAAELENMTQIIEIFFNDYIQMGLNTSSKTDSPGLGDKENKTRIHYTADSEYGIGDVEEIHEEATCREEIEEADDMCEVITVEENTPNTIDEDATWENDVHLSKWLEFPYHAVMTNRLDLLKLCLKTSYNMNVFRGDSNETLLHAAVSKSALNFDVILMLLECIDVNTPDDSDNGSAIHKGLRNTDISEEERLCLVQLFVKSGAELGPHNTMRKSALHSFCAHALHCLTGEPEIPPIESRITNPSSEKNTCGYNIMCREDGTWKQIINNLSASYINAEDGEGFTPLHDLFRLESHPVSSTETLLALMNCLLEKGASLSVVDHSKLSVLHTAVESYKIDMVKYAVDHGCPVNMVSKLGVNPLYHLCTIEYVEDVDIQDKQIPLLDVLVTAGCEINASAHDGTIPLHYCAEHLNADVCEFLLNNGADVNAQDSLGRTPLHIAPKNENESSVIEVLKAYGGLINAQDKYGHTPLHYAAMYNSDEAISKLFQCGADASLSSFLNKISPLHMAAEIGNPIILELLIAAGADVNCVDVHGATPLHYAAYEGEPNTIQALLIHGANANVADQFGNTPLSSAIKMWYFKVAELLTDESCQIDLNVPVLHSIYDMYDQPPIHVSDIEKYFSGTSGILAKIGDAHEISKSILCAPDLKRIDMKTGEEKLIHEHITSLAFAIANRVGEIDDRFKGTVIPSGSSCDGCKTGYPDEFDYLVRLDNLEKCIEDFIPGPTGFMGLTIKKGMVKNVSEFIDNNDYLDSRKLMKHFKELVIRASYDVHKNSFNQIQFRGEFLTDIKYNRDVSRDLSPNLVVWRGVEYKHLVVSFDINPVLHTNDWPLEAVKSSTLLDDLEKCDLFLFPQFVFEKSPISRIKYGSHWCYSFAHVEQSIFRNLSETLKDAFTLCKSLRTEPLMPDIDLTMDGGDTHTIDTDATHETQYSDLCSDSDTLESEEGMFENEDIATSAQLEASEKVSTSRRLAMDTVKSDSDDEMEQYESGPSGDKLISSYHLKQCFLREVEKLPIERRNDANLVELIPYRVYKELSSCYETNNIPSIFLQNHNILNNLFEDSESALPIRLCENIVNMLEKLGFSKHA